MPPPVELPAAAFWLNPPPWAPPRRPLFCGRIKHQQPDQSGFIGSGGAARANLNEMTKAGKAWK